MSKRQPETNLLISYLKTSADAKQIALYETMSKIIFDDIHKQRYRLSAAIRELQMEYGYVARCIRNVGYEFIKGAGVADKVSVEFKSKIKNCIERAENTLNTLEWTQLDSDELKKAISCSIRVQAHSQLVSSHFLAASDIVAASSDRFIDSAKAAAELMKNIG